MDQFLALPSTFSVALDSRLLLPQVELAVQSDGVKVLAQGWSKDLQNHLHRFPDPDFGLLGM